MKKRISCVLLAIIFLPLSVCVNSYADTFNAKLGITNYLAEGLDISPRIEASYEYNPKLEIPLKLGIEYGIGFTTSNAHDTQEETPFTGKSFGRLNYLDYFFTLKWYFTKDMHFGAGIDYMDSYFKEAYSTIQVDVDDEVGAHIQLGWEFTPGWTLINKWQWFDIDIESGLDPVYVGDYKFNNGILEQRSNGNNWMILIERKF